jgi:alkylated DNA repair dioxygenase AlkB
LLANMPDLFGAPALPEGYRYKPDVLSTAEERELVRRFEKLPFQAFVFRGYPANRRIVSFGHGYIFAGQKPRADSAIPDYMRPLIDVASEISCRPPEEFQQVMATEYAPGAGIGWHLDRPSYKDIVSVSFLATCALRLRRKVGDSWERRSTLIEPRSAYLLHGQARNVWQHSIAPIEALRYSVTLRTFRSSKADVAPTKLEDANDVSH